MNEKTPEKPLPEIVKVKDLAELIGCSAHTIRAKIATNPALLWMDSPRPRAWRREQVEPLLHHFKTFTGQGAVVRAKFGKGGDNG